MRPLILNDLKKSHKAAAVSSRSTRNALCFLTLLKRLLPPRSDPVCESRVIALDRTLKLLHLSGSFRSDQSQILADSIAEFVTERGARSLLDIGAGNGRVAIPLSGQVSRYLAVEKNTSHCEALRHAGLDVINAIFPVEIDEQFDMVVASHSIPEADAAFYEPFLAQAWKLVAARGLLLIITFKAVSNSPISRLAEEIAGRKYQDDHRYTLMTKILSTYGDVAIAERTSHFASEEFSDIATVFGSWFWRSAEEESKVKPLLEIAMQTRFRVGGEYRVPTPHRFVATTKRD
jgi:SAM-dependent methyltransferase